MKNKFLKFNYKGTSLILAVSFLAISCNPFSQPKLSGVAKTTNGGADWVAANTLREGEGSIAGLNVAKMEFDPGNRETVFASGFNDGLYKSEDSGGSWRRILSNILAFDFAIDPYDSKIIYAAGYFAERGRVVKSTDGGKSWDEIYSEAQSGASVRSVALNLLQPGQVAVGNSGGSVILSNDGGITWKLLINFEDRINRLYWQNGQVYALVRGKGLYKSTNLQAGEFADLTQSLKLTRDFANNFIGLSEQSFNQAFVDKVAPNLIYLTAGKGVFKTVDEGLNWQKLQLPGKHNSDLPARAVAVARSSSNIVYVSVGQVIYKSTDGGLNWQTQNVPGSGFVNYLLVDPQLPQIAYAGNFVSD